MVGGDVCLRADAVFFFFFLGFFRFLRASEASVSSVASSSDRARRVFRSSSSPSSSPLASPKQPSPSREVCIPLGSPPTLLAPKELEGSERDEYVGPV